MEYTKEIFDNLKENTEPIQYTADIEHKENVLYINDGILYSYDKDGKTVKGITKHFILPNGIYLESVPTKAQTGVSLMKPNNRFCRTNEEQRIIAQKGVEGRKKAQEERKTFKESLEFLLNMEVKADKASRTIGRELYKSLPDTVKKHITEQDLIVLSTIKQAQAGSYNHAVFIRDTVGEKPTDKQEITADIMTDADRSLIEKLHNRMNLSDK